MKRVNSIAARPGRLERSHAVFQLRFAGRTRAMNAAEDLSLRFDTVSDDPAIAVRAHWRQRMDRAFEAIECVMLSGYDHFKRLVIFILANFTCSHTITLSRLGSFAAVLSLIVAFKILLSSSSEA